MDVTLREAERADAERLCALWRESIERLAADAYEPEQVAAWADAVSPDLLPFDESDTHFRVAEHDEDPVGFGLMTVGQAEYLASSAESRVTALYVHPTVAGNGVGSRIYDELERAAREAALDSIGLWASLNAVPFYERHGYERVTDQVVEYGDVTKPVVEMRKGL